MYKVTFECETITPMFLAGADQRTPELRAPSIKGALRFWWRAMHGDITLEQLKKEEAKIFGGTGEKEGKSKIILAIKENKISIGRYTPLPHHTGKSDCNPCNEIGHNSCRKAFKLPCLMPESKFTLLVSVIKNDEVDEKYLESLVILSMILGGFGKRSRRGFGSLRVNLINEIKLKDDINLNFVLSLLNNIVPNKFLIENDIIKLKVISKSFPNYPYIEQIEMGKEYGDWRTLLRDIGLATHKYNNPASDCSLGRVRGRERFASPIYISIIKSSSKYYPIITTLHGAPKNNRCYINRKKQREFIKELS